MKHYFNRLCAGVKDYTKRISSEIIRLKNIFGLVEPNKGRRLTHT